MVFDRIYSWLICGIWKFIFLQCITWKAICDCALDKPAQYTWTQDDEEVTVTFKLSPEMQKDDVCCTIQAKRLDLRIQNSQTVLLSGDFVNSVKADESTWLISDGSLWVKNLPLLLRFYGIFHNICHQGESTIVCYLEWYWGSDSY